MCCLYVVLVLPGIVETQLGWSGKFLLTSCRVFLLVFTGAKSIKNRPRKARVIVKNKVTRFYGLRCIYYYDVTTLFIESVSSASLPSTESNATAVSLPSVSRSVMSSPYTVLSTGKPSDHAFVQLQPQPAHQVWMWQADCWINVLCILIYQMQTVNPRGETGTQSPTPGEERRDIFWM